MRCPRCTVLFDEDVQTVICPHFPHDQLPRPVGGFRFPPEARDGIDAALLKRDREALGRYLEHANPLVRSYAQKIYAAFEQDQSGASRGVSSPVSRDELL